MSTVVYSILCLHYDMKLKQSNMKDRQIKEKELRSKAKVDTGQEKEHAGKKNWTGGQWTGQRILKRERREEKYTRSCNCSVFAAESGHFVARLAFVWPTVVLVVIKE